MSVALALVDSKPEMGKPEDSKDAQPQPSKKTSTQLSIFSSLKATDPEVADRLARKCTAFFKSDQTPDSWNDDMNKAQHEECTKDPRYLNKAYKVRFEACQLIVRKSYIFSKKGGSRSKSAEAPEPAPASDGAAKPKRGYVKKADLECQIDTATVNKETAEARLKAAVGYPVPPPSTRFTVCSPADGATPHFTHPSHLGPLDALTRLPRLPPRSRRGDTLSNSTLTGSLLN